jgi:hypothetical protein
LQRERDLVEDDGWNGNHQHEEGPGKQKGSKETPTEKEHDQASQHDQQRKAGKEKLCAHLTQNEYAQPKS